MESVIKWSIDKKAKAAIAAAVLAVAVVIPVMNAPSAGASESPISHAQLSQEVSPSDFQSAINELIASDVPRTVTHTPTDTTYVFHVPVPEAHNGVFDLGVVVPDSDAPISRVPRGAHTISPYLSAGSDSGGPYFLLNTFDQNMVIGGFGAAVTAALCAIPGVGWISCAVISVAVIAATTWLAMNGVCTRGRQLKGYFFNPVGRYKCV